MRKLIVFLFLLLFAPSSFAQSIEIGTISRQAYCIGDSLDVPYTTTGIFGYNNAFNVQLSDANGSFTAYKNLGHVTANSGSIRIPLAQLGSHFRVKVASNNPYKFSLDNGTDLSVVSYPGLNVVAKRGTSHFFIGAGDTLESLRHPFYDVRPLALVDEPITIPSKDMRSGETFQGQFDQDPAISTSSDTVVTLSYATEGIKTANVTVTNAAGCSSTKSFSYRIASCNPVIPKDTKIVTNDTFGINASSVLVKTGATYRVDSFQMIFVEPGASIHGDYGWSFIYLMPGSSAQLSSGGGTVISGDNTDLYLSDAWDTLHCNALSFDYSELSRATVEDVHPILSHHFAHDHLIVNSNEAAIAVRIYDILGNSLYSLNVMGGLDFDLSLLTSGVYFAELSTNDRNQIVKLVR